ncbi:Hydantoinase/oxoprolinase [Punctularia strigosozonata HHB-11173 SS5]|uniref:Hydantoinase/oxoprolinase n=1 Tax=Punctularia strigosozonata (strain HHB-11173) TaxID=741275 RepID=UPI0004416CA9|nr:Hydantoinase/oxoprolinase [Punctularia strigosozonata HHB-11173 SS5]EIN06702.1 Hydantoinase/oxoprolinase [Punctularia strigosozonata HHB-11173 SS5]
MSTQQRYRIGVDVGGTNTDSVLLDVLPNVSASESRGVMSSSKKPTTPNVTDGIEAAVRSVLEDSRVQPAEIGSLMIGTTHFINAVVEADSRRLSKVAVIRLGAPYTEECPPFIDFPPILRSITEGHVAILKGGLQIDGSAINDIDEAELKAEAAKIRDKGLTSVVLVGIYSPLDQNDGTSQEDRAKDILSQALGPGVDIVCSREVGHAGLLERENASILNASILAFARRTIRGFQRAMNRLGLKCPLFLTQNDGTLITAAKAAKLPIRTFASGATNSMRGAAYLAHGKGVEQQDGVEHGNLVVVDIGGTTTDVGVLLPSGFPRQAAAYIEVAGVRTNFSMPDVQSIGLGGGSRVHVSETAAGETVVSVGPDSTGYKLLTEGLVFGGSTLTATDCVVATDESLQVGDRTKVSGAIPESVLQGARAAMKKLLEDVVDRMKTSPEPATVLLVGGGSILAPSSLKGVANIVRPPFFSCANAVGACVANISGEFDTIEILQDKSLEDVLEKCKVEAIERAVAAGAKKHTVKVVEVENLPVQYVTNKATRIIVRAVGELDTEAMLESSNVMEDREETEEPEGENDSKSGDRIIRIDVNTYVPQINAKREWILSEIDLAWIAEGCGILGTGGGGSPYPPQIMARQILRDGGEIRVISSDSLPDDAVIFRGHFMGSPSVSNERLQAGTETETACRNLAKFVNMGTPAAIISDEIGGGNGIQPMILASAKHLNIPVFDGDLMGRAYPNMWQSLPAAYGVPASLVPCAIADGVGNSVLLPSTSDQWMVETLLRGACTSMGSKAGVSMAPLSAKTCREYGVTRSVSQAWRIGRAVALCRQRNDLSGIPNGVLELQNGKCLFIGKITAVNREWGTVTMVPLLDSEVESARPNGLSANADDALTITFQNENLTAELTSAPGAKQMLAVVPDLITVLDSQSGSSLGTHEYRYGLRVTVLVLASHPLWTTERGLENGGPKAFGLDGPYKPVAQYCEPRSVIEEYGKP